jgi:membrane associated rhomboid family serine protease
MQSEKKKILYAVIFPFFFLVVLWIIRYLQYYYKVDLIEYGIHPLKTDGLLGIITAPLIHADIKHLSANSFPLFFLSACLFYFYREMATKVFFLVWIISGIWVWTFARDAYHIGASGLVYGYGSFLFFSGLLRRHTQLMAISMMITFLYGGLLWGIFPMKDQVSWESHLMGLLSGLVLAIFYMKSGPQRKQYDWGEDDEDADEDEFWKVERKEDVKSPPE